LESYTKYTRRNVETLQTIQIQLIFIHEAILRLHVATQRKDSSSSSQSSTSETSNSRPSSQKNTENSFTNRHPDAERYTFRTGFTSPNFSRNETEWQKEYSQYSHFYRTHFDELRREMEEDESEPFDYFVRRSPNVYRRQSEYQNVHTIWERAVFGDKFVELSNKHEYPPVFECLEYYLDSYHNSGHLFDIFLHKRPLNQLYIVDQGNTIFRFRTGISGTPLQAVKEQNCVKIKNANGILAHIHIKPLEGRRLLRGYRITDSTDQNTLVVGLEYYDWLGARRFEWKKEGTSVFLGSAIRRQHVHLEFPLSRVRSHWTFQFDFKHFEFVPTSYYILNVAVGITAKPYEDIDNGNPQTQSSLFDFIRKLF
jgi:hypothetical protein